LQNFVFSIYSCLIINFDFVLFKEIHFRNIHVVKEAILIRQDFFALKFLPDSRLLGEVAVTNLCQMTSDHYLINMTKTETVCPCSFSKALTEPIFHGIFGQVAPTFNSPGF